MQMHLLTPAGDDAQPRGRRSRRGSAMRLREGAQAEAKAQPPGTGGRWDTRAGAPEADETTQLLWKQGYNVENPFEFDELGSYLGKFPNGSSWGYWPIVTNANWLQACKPVTIPLMRKLMAAVKCPTEGLKDAEGYARRLLNLLDHQYKLIPREEEAAVAKEPEVADVDPAAERQAQLVLRCAQLESDVEVMRATLAGMKEDTQRYLSAAKDMVLDSSIHLGAEVERAVYTCFGVERPSTVPVSAVDLEVDDAPPPPDPTQQRLSMLSGTCVALLNYLESLHPLEGVHLGAQFVHGDAVKCVEEYPPLRALYAEVDEVLNTALRGPQIPLPKSPATTALDDDGDGDDTDFAASPSAAGSPSKKPKKKKKKKKKGKGQEEEGEEKIRVAWVAMEEMMSVEETAPGAGTDAAKLNLSGLVGVEWDQYDPAHYRLIQRMIDMGGKVATMVNRVWRADQDRLINEAQWESEKESAERELAEAQALIQEQTEKLEAGANAVPPPEALPQSITHVENYMDEKRKTLPALADEDSENIRSLLVKIQEMQAVIDSFLEECPPETLGDPPPEAPPDAFQPSSRKQSRNVRLVSRSESLRLLHPNLSRASSVGGASAFGGSKKSVGWSSAYGGVGSEEDFDGDAGMRPIVPTEDKATQTPAVVRDAEFESIFKLPAKDDAPDAKALSRTEQARVAERSRWHKVLGISDTYEHPASDTTRPRPASPLAVFLERAQDQRPPRILSPVDKGLTVAITPLDTSVTLSQDLLLQPTKSGGAVPRSPTFTRQQSEKAARPWRPAVASPPDQSLKYTAANSASTLAPGAGLWRRTPSSGGLAATPSPRGGSHHRGSHVPAAPQPLWSSSAAAQPSNAQQSWRKLAASPPKRRQ